MQNSKERNDALMVMAAYSVLTLVILAVCVSTLVGQMKRSLTPTPYETVIEYVYIPETDAYPTFDTNVGGQESEEAQPEIFTVRAHDGVIGVFSADGEILLMLDVYTKALPKADRDLLEKGFEVIGRSRLNAIIEDYTG